MSFCGYFFFQRQWDSNGGKCGICGDPWDGVRENEAGGRYATGIISRKYKEGQIIDVRTKTFPLFNINYRIIRRMQWIVNAFLYNNIAGAGENHGISFWIF